MRDKWCLSPQQSLGEKATILLVDPDSTDRQLMRRTLRLEGYRVLDAADCRHAENVQQQHRGEIDLLVAALALPGATDMSSQEPFARQRNESGDLRFR